MNMIYFRIKNDLLKISIKCREIVWVINIYKLVFFIKFIIYEFI